MVPQMSTRTIKKFWNFSILDHPSNETHPTSLGEVLPRLDLLRGWRQDVGPVDGAARVHGHLLGLRLVPGHHVRRRQPPRPARRGSHGSLQVPRRHRLLRPLLYCLPPGKQ